VRPGTGCATGNIKGPQRTSNLVNAERKTLRRGVASLPPLRRGAAQIRGKVADADFRPAIYSPAEKGPIYGKRHGSLINERTLLMSSAPSLANALLLSANASEPIGEFFVIDRRSWARVCALGIDPAIAYLTLARGTGRSNATTSWSVNAIEKHARMPRRTARDAIDLLEAAGVIDRVADRTRPRYELRPADKIPGTTAFPRAPIFTGEQAAYDRILNNGYVPLAMKNRLPELMRKGWIIEIADGVFRAAPPPSPEPQAIWLPNRLVMFPGTELSPIAQVRQTRDSLLLRLLIDLYWYNDLPGCGGVDRTQMWKEYRRVKVGQRGEYTVWGFGCGVERTAWTELTRPHRVALTAELAAVGLSEASDWFRRTECLSGLGLLRWVPTLFEGEDCRAAVLHAYSRGTTNGVADRLGCTAHAVGRKMVTDGQYNWARKELGEEPSLVPVLRHIDRVQMVGIARLRYRPETRRTAAWIAQLLSNTREQLNTYRALAVRAGTSSAATAA
jgi:hypothetical protein